jgi:putative phosphoribosyl transferase
MSLFTNRVQAGQQLTASLKGYSNALDTIIIGLPRGGVPIAAQVAKTLNLPLDIIVTRKLGAPFQAELALGALTQDGTPILTHELAHDPRVKDALSPIINRERQELTRRLKAYRRDRPALNLKGKTAIIIDDGIATGATMLAAIESARELDAHKIVVATPVAPQEVYTMLESVVDEIICVATPTPFGAIGQFYTSFPQVEDQEVIDLLKP